MKYRYVLLFVLLFVPAAVTVSLLLRQDRQTPPLALSDRAIEQLDLMPSDDFVPILISRTNLSLRAAWVVAAFIWFPFVVAFASFVFLRRYYQHLKRDRFIFILPGLAFVGVIAVVFGKVKAGVVLIGIALIITPFTAAIARFLTASHANATQDGTSPSRPAPGILPHMARLAFHITISTALFAAAAAMSLSTSRLLTSYHGFKPGSQIEATRLRTLFHELTRPHVPPGVYDDVAWRIEQVPSINDDGSGMTIFAGNRLAIILFIIMAVAYMVSVWVVIIPLELQDLKRKELKEVPPKKTPNAAFEHWDRIVFALSLYLSVGFAFAMLFYNIYIAAAAKQNVMTLYAQVMQLEQGRYEQLRESAREWGPTESLVRQMLDAATPDKATSSLLEAARSRYWPSAVIAQDMPRYSVASRPLDLTGGSPAGATTNTSDEEAPVDPPETAAAESHAETRMMLDPVVTLSDMLYFSFVSFTTTGYGDIRPVSDELRAWTVVENVIEVLFTSMFFTVAFKSYADRGECRRRRSPLLRCHGRRSSKGEVALKVIGFTTVVFALDAHAQPVDPASKLLRSFGCHRLELSELPPVDLIIDDSGSMKGFVRTEDGGRYAKVMRQLVQLLTDNEGGIRRLNRPGRPIERWRDIYDEKFYSEDETPLEHAFRYAEKNPDHITILVSDLQQSTPEASVQRACLALKKALEKTPHALLIGIRSPYAQVNMKCSPRCPSSGTRSVYILVLTSSSDRLRLFVEMTHIDAWANQDRAAIDFGGGQPPLFYSWRPAAEVVQLSVANYWQTTWSEFKNTETVDCGDELLPRVVTYVQDGGKTGTEPLRLLVRATVHESITDRSNKMLQIQKVSLPQARPPQPFDPEFDIDRNGSGPLRGDHSRESAAAFKLEYPGKLAVRKSYDLYQFQFALHPATIQNPNWVKLWDEKSPRSPEELPALDALVRTMVRRVTQSRPALEHFVVIHRE